MQARNLPGRALLWMTLCASSPLLAVSGVVRWESTYHRPLPGVGYQSVAAARELADGTTLTVVQDNDGFTTLQYDHSGNRLASATYYPLYFGYPSFFAIDPFGAVFFATGIPGSFQDPVDIWLTKFDGLTGAPLWPAGVTFGAGNHANDSPVALLVDGAGDVMLQASSSASPSSVVVKYSGQNGQPVWGPLDTGGSSLISQIDSAGDLYVAGHDGTLGGSFYLAKYSGSAGSVIWRLAESGHDLKPVGVGVDGSGNVVVTGGSTSATGSFEADKYSGSTGQKIWGPAIWNPPGGNYSTAPDLAAVGSDGSVVIFGHTFANNQATRELLKFRGADGALLWGPVPGEAAENSYGAVLTLAGNGDVILSAQIQTGQSSSDSKMWRYDGDTGDLLWGPVVTVNAAVGAAFVGSNGRVFVGLGVFNGLDDDVVVLERDGATGAAAWGPTSFTGAAAGWAYLYDLTAAPDGNAIVTGQVMGTDGGGAWATLKYHRVTGAVVWGPVFFSDGFAFATYSPSRVLTDSNGDVLVGGTTSGGMAVVKYSGATGAQLWAATVVVEANVTAFALDPNGNAIITGYADNGTGSDAVTAKLSGVNGATMWGPLTYDSGSDDFPVSVAADSSGVVLAGYSSGVLGTNGFLIKYASADGSVIWGPSTQADLPSWIAVDAAGDVLRESCCSGITTTKYSGATGATLWGPNTVGAPVDGYGTALALDAAGDVLVTGSLYSGQTYDYAVVKYRGSDGAVLWGPVTFDSGENEWAYGIAADGSGNAVVTGYSYSDSSLTERNTATLSYDGATGARRWGPVGRNIARDSVNGLAASGSTVYVGAMRGDLGYVVDAIDESLGIVALPGALPALSCGHAIDVPLGAANGTPPYTWSIVGGGLPPAVVLGVGGDLIGTPQEEGIFGFTVQVQDAALAKATHDFTVAVGPGGPLVPVAFGRDDACQLTLSVDGGYTAYDWLPDGQSTPQIVVDPTEPTTYGVVLNDGTPCRVRGATTIVPFDPSCLAPSVASVSPTSGPGAGTPVTVSGTKFDPSAALSIGGLPASGVVFESAGSLQATTPVLSPGTVADVLVVNPDGRYGQMLRAFAADFLDVPSSNPFYADIMKVLRAGITAGCGNGGYCPNGSVTRAQMAVFLLKAQHGFFYVPPACTGIFADVACPGAFAADWIEQLSQEGITGGCGGGNYCPDAAVTREQMAVFLMKAEHGSNFTPPPCIGIFGDVPCNSPFASWIEQLYDEGITGGCGNGNYCPSNPNTRAQMAVFLTKTFGLP